MIRKDRLYIVCHMYEINEHEEARMIGIFSSVNKANEVIKKHKKLPGFKEYPDGFIVDTCKMEEEDWESGFIISRGIGIPYWMIEEGLVTNSGEPTF